MILEIILYLDLIYYKLILRSGSNKSIVKQNLMIFEDYKMRRDFEDIYSSAVDVSKCGNFGLIGFSNGNFKIKGFISKVNMQSGLH